MLSLPRSARLAAWGTAVVTGDADPLAALRAVQGDDEPHRLAIARVAAGPPVPGQGVPGAAAALGLGPDAGLIDLFAALVRAGACGLRLLLPAPGDPLGLPGPAGFNEAALEAGEALLVEYGDPGAPVEQPAQAGAGPAVGLVPEVVEFGSAWEPGALVTWHVHPVGRRAVTVTGGVAEAERELRTALAEATRELSRLDVARWRDDAADRVAALRDGGLERGALPPSAPPRCVRVLATAARVRAIVELAGEDDGAAVTGHEARRRAEALRGLDAVSRRAVAAAVNGLLEPPPG